MPAGIADGGSSILDAVHVGLNLMFLVPGETGGTEVYARELVTALAQEHPGLRLTAFVNRETAAARDPLWGGAIEAVTIPVRAANRLEWVRGEQTLLAPAAERAGCDVVHSLANTGPLFGRFARVLTLHDLLFMAFPESHFGLRSLGVRVLVPAAARRSDEIVAISAVARDEIVAKLRIDPGRIAVVHNGLGAERRTAPAPADDLRRRLDLGDRAVLLTVSTKRAHKNLARLLEAVARIPEPRRPLLVLPGYRTPHEDELREQAGVLGIAEDVRFPGWVDAAELEGLYALAAAFVYPTRYEGFGLPVLEAMARGVPVACSDIPVLREVAGDAAERFDPADPAAIAAAIEAVIGDGARADRLRAAGRKRAASFTWQAAAQGTAAAYERALARGPRRPARASR